MLHIKILNDVTGTHESANYDYRVYINHNLIASGRVEGHNRNFGWKNLVYMMLGRKKTSSEIYDEFLTTLHKEWEEEDKKDRCPKCGEKNCQQHGYFFRGKYYNESENFESEPE